MNKITYAVITGKEDKLLQSLILKYGMPVCYEDLTIYFVNEVQNVKISIQPLEDLLVSFRNVEGEEQYSFRARPEEIKSVIKSLSHISDGKGYISISDIKKFTKSNHEYIKFIDTKLAGFLCTHYGFSSKEIKHNTAGFTTLSRPQRKDAKLESIISSDVAPEGILNSKILQYLDRNGLHYRINNAQLTYRQLMNAKSNDYSLYEPAFELMTDRAIVDSRPIIDGAIYIRNQTLSIIIPYFNSSTSIKKVLHCIDNQVGIDCFGRVQVIIVDDCSTIPLSEVIKSEHTKYSFELLIIRSEQNVGVSTAREVGTALSTGDLLVYIDSDILLDKYYLIEHTTRMLAIPNAVFISMKENIEPNDVRVDLNKIVMGLERPTQFDDLRIYKKFQSTSLGSYVALNGSDTRIMESTNFFKSFNGSKVYGVYDLSCMIVGHNFSTRRSNVYKARPFSSRFKGWGMEDVYSGLRFINSGIYIIPVVSTGVYHLNHAPRSGSEVKKRDEYEKNVSLINELLDSPFDY